MPYVTSDTDRLTDIPLGFTPALIAPSLARTADRTQEIFSDARDKFFDLGLTAV
jgi:hypothetical protein